MEQPNRIINVAGDYVQSKYVEYEIGNVEPTGKQELISIPTNGKLWQIVESHFVDTNSRSFHNLHKQKESKTAIPAIEKMLKILQPST